MSDTLIETKAQLRNAYLGKVGIHAFGIDRYHQVIQVYVTPGGQKDLQDVLDDLRRAAAPFKVNVVEGPAPHLA